MNRNDALFFLLASHTIWAGCQWTPPHDNPVDPEHYLYQPTGSINFTVLDTLTEEPLYDAEVALPDLGRTMKTDSSGAALFTAVPVGTHRATAERRVSGLIPYELAVIQSIVRDGETSHGEFKLTALSPFGSIRVNVKTIANQSIWNATVYVLTEPFIGTLTDQGGAALFDNVPVGTWWIKAFRGSGQSPEYAPDSVQVIVIQNATTSVDLTLDAIPVIRQAGVISKLISDGPGRLSYSLRLKADIFDPDGPGDLETVQWSWADTVNGKLSYNPDPDSLFWSAELGSDLFPEGQIGFSREAPIIVEAIDYHQNRARSSVYVQRVITTELTTQDYGGEAAYPPLVWTFYWGTHFESMRMFRYLVKVYRRNPERSVEYDTLLVPTIDNQTTHQIARRLNPGIYDWFVWAIGNQGDYSRSRQSTVRVGSQ